MDKPKKMNTTKGINFSEIIRNGKVRSFEGKPLPKEKQKIFIKMCLK